MIFINVYDNVLVKKLIIKYPSKPIYHNYRLWHYFRQSIAAFFLSQSQAFFSPPPYQSMTSTTSSTEPLPSVCTKTDRCKNGCWTCCPVHHPLQHLCKIRNCKEKHRELCQLPKTTTYWGAPCCEDRGYCQNYHRLS